MMMVRRIGVKMSVENIRLEIVLCRKILEISVEKVGVEMKVCVEILQRKMS